MKTKYNKIEMGLLEEINPTLLEKHNSIPITDNLFYLNREVVI